jgi:hypothetical protein
MDRTSCCKDEIRCKILELAAFLGKGKWRSWHHHMAMVMMALLFMLEQRLLHKEQYPLLSCFDIVSILSFILPHRATTEQEVIRQLEVRHERRRSAIESAYRIQLQSK